MGASLEPRPVRLGEYRSSQLKRPIVLRGRSFRLSLEPDGSVRYLDSLAERRLLFGREQVQLCKIQAGLIVHPQRQEWMVTVSPREVSFSSRVFDSVEVSQTLRPLPTSSVGYSRRIGVRNTGSATVKIRMLALQDPTTAHFRDRSLGWGSIGVNAFNRSSHVAMDEVAEPPAARVVGSQPPPRLFYLTANRNKAVELLQSCDLPEPTAGMSGQVLILSLHEFDLPPGAGADLTYVSLYNPAKLEDALSDFGSMFAAANRQTEEGLFTSSSSAHLSAGLSWASSELEGVEYEGDMLDRLETLRGLPFLDPAAAKAVVESARSILKSNGALGHSANSLVPGILETAVFLDGASRLALLTGEKKYMRAVYPALRRAANFLLSVSADGSVHLDPSLPQGWRRRIGRGYPAGEIPEVSLATASALGLAASLAAHLGKGQDSAKFKERSDVICSCVRKRMVDERGSLVLYVDEAGRPHAEETVDQAVACYRHPFDRKIGASLVHRMLEKDFETGYGPRTVPSSNRTWFNGSYGEGQLGGYWTRASLAQAVLAYQLGFGGTGRLALESVGRLVSSDAVNLGSSPGVFPHWLDVERREAHGGGDPVAASRFVETVLTGELGLSLGPEGLALKPSLSSNLRWLLVEGLWMGKRASVFLGRGGGRTFTFLGGADARVEGGWKHSGWTAARTDDARLTALSLHDPGQVVCVGNSSDSAVKSKVLFRPQDPELSRHLTAGLQEFDTVSSSWKKTSVVKVLSVIAFDVSLPPGEWKAFKLSTG